MKTAKVLGVATVMLAAISATQVESSAVAAPAGAEVAMYQYDLTNSVPVDRFASTRASGLADFWYRETKKMGKVLKRPTSSSRTLNTCKSLSGDYYVEAGTSATSCISGEFVAHIGYASTKKTGDFTLRLHSCSRPGGKAGLDQYEATTGSSVSSGCPGATSGPTLGWIKS